MKKNNLRIVSLLCAFILSFSILTTLTLKPVKAETINEKLSRMAIPIFTFFMMGMTSRSKGITDAITSEVNDIKFLAKNWWENLTSSQREKIETAVEYNEVVRIDDYQEYGFNRVYDFSNTYSNIQPSATTVPFMNSTLVTDINNSFLNFTKTYGKSISLKYKKMIEYETAYEHNYRFFYNLTIDNSVVDFYIVVQPNGSFIGSQISDYNTQNDYGSGSHNQILKPGYTKISIGNVSYDLGFLMKVYGQYTISYDNIASIPVSLPLGNIAGSDTSTIKGIYDGVATQQLTLDGIKSIQDAIAAGNVASEGTLEEVKKSNGFLGTIADFLTVTLPTSLGNIWTGVKAIPTAIGAIPGAIESAIDYSVPQDISLDFSPMYVGISNKFPFSIPWDLIHFFNIFKSDRIEPEFKIEFDKRYFLGGGTFTFDFKKLDKFVVILRFFTLSTFLFFLIKITRNIIKG